MNSVSQLAFDLTEQGLVPDAVIRRGIRHLVKQRLKEIQSHDCETMASELNRFIAQMRQSPVALLTEKANEQHYEVPAEFFVACLGPRLKYSSAYWPQGVNDLATAEEEGLKQTCVNAELANGQDILELGCGWGSLTLWMAEHYPDSRITAVSNSYSQRRYIEGVARDKGFDNIRIITCDMNDFSVEAEQFDRVVSVEMFEHMRNWPQLYRLVASALRPGGQFFKHIFVHRDAAYTFEDKAADDWMSRYFFSGGMMPSDDLPLAFQQDLQFVRRQRWDGRHYEKTANAWLENMDKAKAQLSPFFKQVYGEGNEQMWWARWRIFYMACAELFAYDKGQQWWVSHYLFKKPRQVL